MSTPFGLVGDYLKKRDDRKDYKRSMRPVGRAAQGQGASILTQPRKQVM
jgi:hypothetical protein